jgi:hypothetical protein
MAYQMNQADETVYNTNPKLSNIRSAMGNGNAVSGMANNMAENLDEVRG